MNQEIQVGFNTASVLIQHGNDWEAFKADVSFNTASVLIQRFYKDIEELLEMFQYSFCSYSTDYAINTQLQFGSFNTASVLIQPVLI